MRVNVDVRVRVRSVSGSRVRVIPSGLPDQRVSGRPKGLTLTKLLISIYMLE